MKKRFATEFNPRLSDFDLQGILNSKCYIDFLAEARLHQMIHNYGIPFEHYAKKNQTWVLANLSISFLKPIYFGMRFQVETEVTSIEGPKAIVDFAFRGLDKNVVFSSGSATYFFVDLSTKRPIDVPLEDIRIFLSENDPTGPTA